MKDEIKEILDKLEKHIEHIQFASLANYELRLLLDYITNLQTIEQQYSAILSENAELENKITNLQEQLHKASLDIQELTEKDIGCPSWCDKLTDLQEENERLKEENNRLYDLCESNKISYLEGIEYAKQLNGYKYDGFVEKWLKEMKEKLQRGD